MWQATYTNNRRDGLSYDAAGNVIHDGFTSFQYDATGQQTFASSGGMQQSYDGDRLRVKKVENGVTTYYLRSTMLGGQVVAELGVGGNWTRGYIYMGGQLLAIQQGDIRWAEQDPVVKSQRLSDAAGYWRTWLELDAWGGQTPRSGGQTAEQPRQFTTYERDANMEDEAMHRRYNRWWSRFSQPDPYDGSYDLTDPQSFNRYSYVQNDPVNYVDPTGLDGITIDTGPPVTVIGNINQSIDPGLISSLNGSVSFIPLADIGEGRGGTDPGGLEPQNAEPPQQNRRNAQKCASLVRKMIGQIATLDRLHRNYDPVRDFFGGEPYSHVRRGRRISGVTQPRSHYNNFQNAQRGLGNALEEFKRDCMGGNDNSNPGLPSGAEHWSNVQIREPYDPSAPTLFDNVRDFFTLPTQDQMERHRRQSPWLYPPVFPFPIPGRP